MSKETQLSTFEEIIEKVLKHEGGYVNDPDDAGGETNYGISKKAFPDIDIKNLTRKEAKEIYKNEYWDKSKVEKVPKRLRHIYFDMCVNFGTSGAISVLQRSANSRGSKLSIDGKLGPLTLGSIKNIETERVRAYRILRFAKIVSNTAANEKYWFGWYNRATEV